MTQTSVPMVNVNVMDGWMGGRKKITQKDSSLLNDVVCWRLLSRKAQYFAIK